MSSRRAGLARVPGSVAPSARSLGVWSSLLVVLAVLLGMQPLCADPWIPAGDVALRSDLQLLADYGIVREPSQTWPRSWPEVARAVVDAPVDGLPDYVIVALARVRAAAEAASKTMPLAARVSIAGAVHPTRLRTFEDSPRENAQAGISVASFGDNYSARLNVTGALDPADGQQLRLDGSYAAVLAGNWSLTLAVQDRWFGPGNDGSLILSSNARPIPMLTLDRNYADPFESPWLSWIGPWRLSLGYGVLEGNRDFAHPHFISIRGSIRPFESLELGAARVAIWCGKDRPCNARALKDVLFGNESNLDDQKNPANQLAQLDFRWRLPRQWLPLAVYGSLVGEDSISPNGTPDIKDYLPSRRLGQVGVETWGAIASGSFRVHAEFADTVCRYSVPDPDYDCAYEHFIYTDGYRYRGRAIGHALDGDGQSFSVGGTYVDDFGDPWSFTARSVEINVAGLSSGNTVSSDRRKLYNLEFSHRREIKIGTVELGVGYDHITEGNSDDRLRANLRFSVDLY